MQGQKLPAHLLQAYLLQAYPGDNLFSSPSKTMEPQWLSARITEQQ
jgi:hypothetical protein